MKNVKQLLLTITTILMVSCASAGGGITKTTDTHYEATNPRRLKQK